MSIKQNARPSRRCKGLTCVCVWPLTINNLREDDERSSSSSRLLSIVQFDSDSNRSRFSVCNFRQLSLVGRHRASSRHTCRQNVSALHHSVVIIATIRRLNPAFYLFRFVVNFCTTCCTTDLQQVVVYKKLYDSFFRFA